MLKVWLLLTKAKVFTYNCCPARVDEFTELNIISLVERLETNESVDNNENHHGWSADEPHES